MYAVRLWFVLGGVPALTLHVPLGAKLELWAAGTTCAPPELDPRADDGVTLAGRHEQRLLGMCFVTHHSWFRPVTQAER